MRVKRGDKFIIFNEDFPTTYAYPVKNFTENEIKEAIRSAWDEGDVDDGMCYLVVEIKKIVKTNKEQFEIEDIDCAECFE